MATRISSALGQRKLIQSAQVEWGSLDNFILLNPFLTEKEIDALSQLTVKVSQAANLQSHIWFATSGSTAENQSRVKMVALSQRALVNSAKSVVQWIQATDQDRWLQVLPFFHVGGLGIELRSQLTQAQLFFSEANKWNPFFFADECLKQQITITSLVPTQIFDLVENSITAPPSLRVIFVGGGQLNSGLYLKARKLGWPVLPSYGMTETGSMIACADLNSLTLSEQNPPLKILPHAKLRANSEDLLEIDATSLMTLYARNLNDDGSDFEYIDPKIKGIFISEDCGQVVDGSLTIDGRKNDFIKIAGEASNLGRLRDILNQLTKNQEIALVKIPDQRLGQKLILAYVSHVSDSISLVVEKFNLQVMPFEKIRQTIEVNEIPRSALGKILYEKLNLIIQNNLKTNQSGG